MPHTFAISQGEAKTPLKVLPKNAMVPREHWTARSSMASCYSTVTFSVVFLAQEARLATAPPDGLVSEPSDAECSQVLRLLLDLYNQA